MFHADEGDRVKRGDLISQLDPTNAQDAIRQQQVILDQAQRSLQRMETLFEARSIQQSQLDDVKDQYERAKIGLDQARLNLVRCSMVAPTDGTILKQHVDSKTSVAPGVPIYSFQSDDVAWIRKVDLTDRNALRMKKNAKANVLSWPTPTAALLAR